MVLQPMSIQAGIKSASRIVFFIDVLSSQAILKRNKGNTVIELETNTAVVNFRYNAMVRQCHTGCDDRVLPILREDGAPGAFFVTNIHHLITGAGLKLCLGLSLERIRGTCSLRGKGGI